MHAILDKNLELADILIDEGANLDLQDDNGWTALMYACENHFNVIVDKLILKGANIDILNKRKTNALMISCKHNNLEADT